MHVASTDGTCVLKGREPAPLAARLTRIRAAALRYLPGRQAEELARNVAQGDAPSVAEVRASIATRLGQPKWWPAGTLRGGDERTAADGLARALALAWTEPGPS